MDNHYQYSHSGGHQHLEGFGLNFDTNRPRNIDEQTSFSDHSGRHDDRDYAGRRGDHDYSHSPKSSYRDWHDVDSSLHISVSDLNIRDFPDKWDATDHYSGQHQRRRYQQHFSYLRMLRLLTFCAVVVMAAAAARHIALRRESTSATHWTIYCCLLELTVSKLRDRTIFVQ
jgi:hypothetical protein